MAEWTSVPDPNWSDRRLVPDTVGEINDLVDRTERYMYQDKDKNIHEKLDEILALLKRLVPKEAGIP